MAAGRRAVLALVVWTLGALLVATASTSRAATRLSIEVRLGALSDRALDLTMIVDDWPDSQLVLRAVPTYLDNPTAVAEGEILHDLVVRDAEGGVLPLEPIELEGGESGWLATGVPGRFAWSYRITPRFTAGQQVRDYAIRIPYMDARSAWLLGNHVFVVPEIAGPRWLALRAPTPVAVRFVTPDNVAVVGPPAEFELPHLFALLSLQFGFGRFEVLQGDVAGGAWSVILDAGARFTPAEKETLARRTREMTARAAALFGGVPLPRMGLHVFRHDGLGGLEGAFAAQAYLPRDVDLASMDDPFATIFFRVAMHEFVHAWLPIALFGVDDPWLKEGVTSYYGNVLAARAGWLLPREVEELFASYADDVFGEVTLETVALSDPRLWWREYDGENWRRVTYERGRAVALLLDVHLREKTDNHHALDDVMKVLYARHLHAAFDRVDLLDAILAATGVDARGFFTRYVDGTRPPSASEVRGAHLEAMELGVYRTGRADESYTATD